MTLEEVLRKTLKDLSDSGADCAVVGGLSLGVAVEADVADPRRRHQVQKPVEQAVAGAQDRDEDQLLALENRRLHLGHRRADRLGGQLQVPQGVETQQVADLPQKLAELRRGRVDRPHQGELVLNQRVIDDGDVPAGPAYPSGWPWPSAGTKAVASLTVITSSAGGTSWRRGRSWRPTWPGGLHGNKVHQGSSGNV